MDKEKFFENIKSYRLLAKKELGQNFLIEPSICERIANLLPLNENDEVLEIGCGFGSLTYFLIQKAKVTAIDIDERCLLKVEEDLKSDALTLEKANVLKYDLNKFPYIVGNLPYYITSKILLRILLEAENFAKGAYMIQKEAFNHLTDVVGRKEYGPLAVLANTYYEVKKEFEVGPSNFTPVPKVSSLVFTITKRDDVDHKDKKDFYNFLRLVFSNRRKTIYNNLKGPFSSSEIEEAFTKNGVASTSRAEDLKPKVLENLYKSLTSPLK